MILSSNKKLYYELKKDLTYTKGYIYKITSPSGKIYIGQTINVYRRKSHYKYINFKKVKRIKIVNSIQKYGWENHKFEVIEECLCGKDRENINNIEKYWINKYDSFKNGLNSNKGGNSYVYSTYSDDRKHWLKDKTHSDKTKTKISESLKKRHHIPEERIKYEKSNFAPIYCITNCKLYKSVTMAEFELKIPKTKICAVCRGKRKRAYGYEFRYATPEEKERLFN